MKERGIIFKAEMVRAILEGTKTQTRRIVKPQPENIQSLGEGSTCFSITQKRGGMIWRPCPHGIAGDRLWVRETFKPDNALKGGGIPRLGISFGEGIQWREGNPNQSGPWKPSIHMPRWASRITLEITKVRVERVQEISEADAKAEGMQATYKGQFANKALFGNLWDSINGAGAWERNDWVWVLEFRKL